MPYFLLIAVTAAMATISLMGALGANLREMSEDGVHSPLNQLKRLSVPFLTFLASLALAGPLLQTIIAGVRMHQGDDVVLDPSDAVAHGSWGIYAVVVSIPLLVILAALAFRRARAVGSDFAATGAMMVFLAGTIVATMTVVSHFTWYRDAAHDGWADLQMIRKIQPVKDVDCNAAQILIHREPGKPLEYRCPTLFLLAPYSTQPVAPWPSFKDGTSAELATVLEEFESKAQTIQRHDNNDAAQ